MGFGIFMAVGVLAAFAWADERIEMSTYIPVPSDRLHANRGTIGSAYRPELVPDASVPDGTLLVSGNVGVGTSAIQTHPDPSVTTGKVDVYDVFLRAANRWASQLAGGPTTSGQNSSAVSYDALFGSESTLVTLAVTTSGRPVVVLGNVMASNPLGPTGITALLYRDGLLVDQGVANGQGLGARCVATVVKGEMALPVGSHTFELRFKRFSGTGGTVRAGDAKLIVMEL